MAYRKWVERTSENPGGVDETAVAEEEVVLLIQGKNRHDRRIWSYVKVPVGRLKALREALAGGHKFDIREYGEVLAAGQGEPSEAIRREMAEEYRMVPVTPEE